MNPSPYRRGSFSLLVFSFPVIGYAQKGKGKGKHGNYELRRFFERESLVPKPVLEGEKQISKPSWGPNKKGFGTLQEAQDQLIYEEESKTKYVPKTIQVEWLTQTLRSAFTVTDIQKQFPYISDKLIYDVLNEITSSSELTLIQKGGAVNPSVWIRTDVLEETGWTPEQALGRYYKSPNLFTRFKIGRFLLFVQNVNSAFTITNIRNQFPDLPYGTILLVLRRLTSAGELILLQQGGPGRPSVWIRTTVLNEENLTPRQALMLNSYYGEYGLPVGFKTKEVLSSVQVLESAFTISNLRTHFPYLSGSDGLIRYVLGRLTSFGKLTLLYEGGSN